MAIKVNGKLVAGGKGEDGKSAYQYAVDGGYTGTEAEFQTLMATGPWLPLSGGKMNGMPILSYDGIYTIKSGAIPIGIYGSTVAWDIYHGSSGSAGSLGITVSTSEGFPAFLNFSNKNNIELEIAPSGIPNVSSDIQLCGIAEPTKINCAATKKYVDDSISSAIDDSCSSEY